MSSGAPCPPEEADSYHRALARILSAKTLPEAKDIANQTLRHWRTVPREIRQMDEMNGLKTYGNGVDD